MKAFYTAIFILAIVIMALGLSGGINVVADKLGAFADYVVDLNIFDSPEELALYKKEFGK